MKGDGGLVIAVLITSFVLLYELVYNPFLPVFSFFPMLVAVWLAYRYGRERGARLPNASQNSVD